MALEGFLLVAPIKWRMEVWRGPGPRGAAEQLDKLEGWDVERMKPKNGVFRYKSALVRGGLGEKISQPGTADPAAPGLCGLGGSS